MLDGNILFVGWSPEEDQVWKGEDGSGCIMVDRKRSETLQAIGNSCFPVFQTSRMFRLEALGAFARVNTWDVQPSRVATTGESNTQSGAKVACGGASWRHQDVCSRSELDQFSEQIRFRQVQRTLAVVATSIRTWGHGG